MGETATAPVNATDVTPVKPVPVMFTSVPGGPAVGVKLVMAGLVGGVLVTVKIPALVAHGAIEVETWMGPLIAPGGTVAVICVALTARNSPGRQAMPPKSTEYGLRRLVPVIVTTVPGGPDDGEKPVTVGDPPPLVTTKTVRLSILPRSRVAITIGPVLAPGGTVAVTCVALRGLKVLGRQAWPPNDTERSRSVVRSAPLTVIVTTVPCGPDAGLKPVIHALAWLDLDW